MFLCVKLGLRGHKTDHQLNPSAVNSLEINRLR